MHMLAVEACGSRLHHCVHSSRTGHALTAQQALQYRSRKLTQQQGMVAQDGSVELMAACLEQAEVGQRSPLTEVYLGSAGSPAPESLPDPAGKVCASCQGLCRAPVSAAMRLHLFSHAQRC